MRALPQQMGATMCVAVLALPHLTLQLPTFMPGLPHFGMWTLPFYVHLGHFAVFASPDKTAPGSSYPERTFRGSQLLDSSISLLPLYPNLMIDLHIRIATSFHQSFLQLCHSSLHTFPNLLYAVLPLRLKF